jgi:hypothetical protein
MNAHEKTMLLAVAMHEVAAIVKRYGPTLARELVMLFEGAAGAARRIQKNRGRADGREDRHNVGHRD